MQQLGKYHLVRRLAVGGMAEVFLAKAAGPKGFEKTLVLKRILPHLAEDQQFVELFLSEAKIAAQLNHPNIVQIYDFGEAEGAYYIAMEYIDGPNLRFISRRTIEKRTLLPIPLCVKVISLACEGLAYAHEFTDPQTGTPLHLVHCDVSPENILMSRNGSVKVVDFGIAKAAGVSPQTKVGTFKGKVSYMPPERIQGNAIDLRADIFSLGVVLYELLTGVKPFNARTDVSILHAILQEPIIPVASRRPDVPELLSRILARTLAKDPENRYRSCRELQRDLERFLVTIGKAVGSYHLARLVSYATDSLAANAAGGQPQTGPKTPPGIPPVRPLSPLTPTPVLARPDLQPANLPASPVPPPRLPSPAWQEASIIYDESASQADLAFPRRGRGPAYVAVAMVFAASVAGYALTHRHRGPTSGIVPIAIADPPPPVRPPSNGEQQQPPGKPRELASVLSSTASGPSKPAVPNPPPAQATSEEPPKKHRVRIAVALASFDVESRPAGMVRVNGKLVGLSPVRVRNQPPGTVRIEVSNAEKVFSKQQTFEVNSGDNGTKLVVVEQGTVEFRIRPYAAVILDGKALGQTPLSPVQVYEGKHSIHLVNPEISKEVSIDFIVKPGQANIFKYNLND